jgi:branched-chain amino acid transport system substrate-binding protein
MYDAAAILDAAMSKVDGEVTRQAINDALGEIGTITGVRGDLFLDDNRTIVQSHYLVQIQETDSGLAPVTLQELPAP